MTNAPFQKGKEERVANRADKKQHRVTKRENKPFVNGTKDVGHLLNKLENPEKTREKHGIKKGVKAMAALGTAGALIPKVYKKLVGPMINGTRYPAGHGG